ncbi:Transcription accessory protein (S1 RNA-binding domain) [Chitinispirillum alkaliphilum]|nr:Transcription accessory protein (S1 RNA-binding domain) [Chitinispirillum alkaliphilum]
MPLDITQQIAEDFSLNLTQTQNTLSLFDEGGTVPFIARYRKEMTGSLDEIQIRDIQHRYTYYKELEERKESILESIKSQGKLTPELQKKIIDTLNKTELEDLYLPYKPKRTTRATKAKEAGLEPLALWLFELNSADADITEKANEFLNPEKEIDTPQKALQGASDILAEQLSDDAEIRKTLRELAIESGNIKSSVKKEFEKQKSKFEMYYDFSEKVSTLPAHRILAMLRGEREKVLRLSLEMPQESALHQLRKALIRFPESSAAQLLESTVQDSYERLLLPATETEIRKEIRDRAEAESFKVFGKNLEALLLSPPAGRKSVIGIDPGFRTGCKVVVVDDTGKFIENCTIYPHEPQNKKDEAKAVILALVQKHKTDLIAIGNGTAGRETEEFIRAVLKDAPKESRPLSLIVNESGASIYSASDTAIKEFPDLDLTVRGAISIARRLQDPLSELVKIDPKSIGVGQYQHDVNQNKLKDELDEVVESCVNRVGVDINLASEELLKFVSGLNRLTASNIVKHRNKNGAFSSRDELMNVSGMGDKKFQLSAGFLRIAGAKNILDNSSVHPERYGLVEKMSQELKTSVRELIGNSVLIRSIKKEQFVSDEVGLPTIEDILKELERPGRDPREEFHYARFNEDINEISDLKEGMILEGTVTNVTNFGAFVDIGVHQDGLVHISQLSNSFVSDPAQVVKVGQVVKVRVISADAELKRISLSMKLEPEQGESARKGPSSFKDKGNRRKEEGKKSTKLKTIKPKINIKRLLP